MKNFTFYNIIISFLSLIYTLHLAPLQGATDATLVEHKLTSAIPAIKQLVVELSHLPSDKKQPITAKSLTTTRNDPHLFQLTPSQLAEFYQSDFYLNLNLEIELPLLEKLKKNKRQVKVIHLVPPIAGHADDDDHGDGDDDHSDGDDDHSDGDDDHGDGDHPHEDDFSTYDPHVWLSPQAYTQLATTLTQLLRTLYPQYNAYYQANLTNLQKQVTEITALAEKTLANAPTKTLYTIHPLFTHLAEDYAHLGLKTTSLVSSGHRKPSAQEINTFLQKLRTEKSSPVLFIDPQEERLLTFIQKEYAATTPTPPPLMVKRILPTQENTLQLLKDVIQALHHK